MTDVKLYTKISSLPESLKSEVIDYIKFNSSRRKKAAKKSRFFGYAKDSIIIKPGFDDHIEDFKEYM